MAANNNETEKKQNTSVIDPIYQKFSRSVVRALASTEFYEFFMDAISRADNSFQFSNRKVEKLVDLDWVDAIDEALEGFQNIIANPRNRIREDELIVNAAHAKKAGADTVRHLAQHSALVEDFNETTGDVRPSKLMQKYREDTIEMYENRLAFTVLEHAYHFVKIRRDALFEAMQEEYGAKLKVESNMESATELMHIDTYLHVKKKDSALEIDEKNQEVFNKIDRMYRLLGSFMNTTFAEQLKKTSRVKGSVTKTNVLKKNPDYKKIAKLWDFLRTYEDVGYMIKITEQNPEIDERFQQDIYHNIMFQYIILKGYLEDERDRAIPEPLHEEKKEIKPKVIHSIIEELTEDYDLPDVEIRKVLIEELTKEQLMLEEEKERLRLVEEAEARRRAREKEEADRKREEELQKQREQEIEEERLRLEKEAEEKRLFQERMERELEDRRRSGLFKKEIEWFEAHREERLAARMEELEKLREAEGIQDYADEALKQMEIEKKKEEKLARKAQRAKEAEERARKKEEERLEQLRMEQLAIQYKEDMKIVGIYLEEARYLMTHLDEHLQERAQAEEDARIAREAMEKERRLRQEKKQQSNRLFRWRMGNR